MTATATRSAKVIIEAGAMVADRCVILPGVILKRGSVLGSGKIIYIMSQINIKNQCYCHLFQ